MTVKAPKAFIVFKCVLVSLQEGLSVRPSVGPSVRNAFVSTTRKRVISASEVEGDVEGREKEKEGIRGVG